LDHHNYAIENHLEKDVIHIWDLEQAKQIRKFAAEGWFMHIQFTPDGKRIFARCSTAKGSVSHGWDIATGAALTNALPALGSATAFHPNGKRSSQAAAAGSTNGTWQPGNERRQRNLATLAHVRCALTSKAIRSLPSPLIPSL